MGAGLCLPNMMGQMASLRSSRQRRGSGRHYRLVVMTSPALRQRSRHAARLPVLLSLPNLDLEAAQRLTLFRHRKNRVSQERPSSPSCCGRGNCPSRNPPTNSPTLGLWIWMIPKPPNHSTMSPRSCRTLRLLWSSRIQQLRMFLQTRREIPLRGCRRKSRRRRSLLLMLMCSRWSRRRPLKSPMKSTEMADFYTKEISKSQKFLSELAKQVLLLRIRNFNKLERACGFLWIKNIRSRKS